MAAGTEGVQLPVPSDLRDEFLWQALKIKVLHPDQFLPVTDVKVRLSARLSSRLQHFHVRVTIECWQTRTSDDGKGTYREMTLHGSVIIENIYLNESALEVVFVKEDGGGEVCRFFLQALCNPGHPSMPPHSAPSNSTTMPSSQTPPRPCAHSSSVCATPPRRWLCTGRPLLMSLGAAFKRFSIVPGCCRNTEAPALHRESRGPLVRCIPFRTAQAVAAGVVRQRAGFCG